MKAKRVLIVDDDDQLRTMLVSALEEWGYETLQADTGKRALEVLPLLKIDLIICDIRMPTMNGVIFLETVKTISPKPPVIMITGFVPSPKQRVSIQAMADAFLQKPFSLKTLQDTIEKLINSD